MTIIPVTELLLVAAALGPLYAFRGGQFKALSHRLPPKTPTVLLGMGIAHLLGLDLREWGFWAIVAMTMAGESTGWTVAMKAACGDRNGAYISWALKEESRWEKLLGLNFLINHPYQSLLLRGLLFASPFVLGAVAIFFATGNVFIEALIAGLALVPAISVGAFVANKSVPSLSLGKMIDVDVSPPERSEARAKKVWKIQEWVTGWTFSSVAAAAILFVGGSI